MEEEENKKETIIDGFKIENEKETIIDNNYGFKEEEEEENENDDIKVNVVEKKN